jgi:hypothetical protein
MRYIVGEYYMTDAIFQTSLVGEYMGIGGREVKIIASNRRLLAHNNSFKIILSNSSRYKEGEIYDFYESIKWKKL